MDADGLINMTPEQKVKFCMEAALQLEPYIYKKGAVNTEENLEGKAFEEFTLSSTLAMLKWQVHDPYQALYDAVELNVSLLGSTRMWGAIELLFLYAASFYEGTSVTEYMVKYTTRHHTELLNKTRKLHWRGSSKEFKANYDLQFTENIDQHYSALLEYGMKHNIDLITSWCKEIVTCMPTVERIYNYISLFPMNSVLHEKIPEFWDVLMAEGKFKVGQLADFVVVALFKYLYANYFGLSDAQK